MIQVNNAPSSFEGTVPGFTRQSNIATDVEQLLLCPYFAKNRKHGKEKDFKIQKE